MRPLRWGIIGLGRFGEMHARTLAGLPGIELAAFCTRNSTRLDEVGSRFGVSKRLTDYRALLDDREVDVVSITTHWQEHLEPALVALACGKHVLLEKPMAATAEQCRRLVAAAEQASGFLMVGHVCRFDPRVTLACQAIRGGRIGRIVSMHARRNLRRAAGSLRLDKISPLMGDGIHDADLMLWFTGLTPTRVHGRTLRVDNFRYPDIGWAMIEFGEQAIGVIETIWRLPENTPFQIDARMEVIGTEGALYIDCANAGLAIQDSAGLSLPDTAYWPTQYGNIVGALSHELAYFADCVRRGERPTVITPREAAQAVAVIETAERAAALGQILEFE
jgi:UDP-N-acetylglucosamine 3-dehydrogenase